VKVLIVTVYFPPSGGGGVQRPLKFATHLPALGFETHVLAPDDPNWIHRDPEPAMPTQALVHRSRYLGPRGRRPAEELHGRTGVDRIARQASLLGRRLLVPDEAVGWNVTAIPAALRIAREEAIDAVITTSPPPSVHFVGAAVKRATGARWIADLRDSLGQHAHRRGDDYLAARLKEEGHRAVARLAARYADAIVGVSPAITAEIERLDPAGRVLTIGNGCDFEDFSGLEYTPADRFRITHTGSFFGQRSPRTFLTALAESGLDAVARFVGDFRTADLEWAETLDLGDRLRILPYVSRRRALELQRDSEALLLLIPEAGGRGRGVLSAKIFEYIAAERPILAAVPPDGEAAALLRRTGAGIVVAPDDTRGIREALAGLHARWRAGALNGSVLTAEQRESLSRRARVEELAGLLRSLA
jgi:glycosyltransferase involved in cell wall biosynthesis